MFIMKLKVDSFNPFLLFFFLTVYLVYLVIELLADFCRIQVWTQNFVNSEFLNKKIIK